MSKNAAKYTTLMGLRKNDWNVVYIDLRKKGVFFAEILPVPLAQLFFGDAVKLLQLAEGEIHR